MSSANGSRVSPDHEVVIVGAGLGGIGAGVALRRAGIDDFVLIDKWSKVGGTWLANTYPGVAVDVPSPVYNFSFQPRSQWSRFFAPGVELQRYAEEVVDRQGLRDKLRLGSGVVLGVFDEERDRWRLTLEDGAEVTARYVIGAVGGLEQPHNPDIPGLDTFTGKIMHSSRWDHDYDYRGKRVAVIGTGATALQLIPRLAEQVSQLTVYQRRAIWIGPKPDFAMGRLANAMLNIAPLQYAIRAIGNVSVNAGLGAGLAISNYPRITSAGMTAAETFMKAYLFSQVRDRELRRKLTPDYRFGCKRPSVSNDYFKTFTRGHVDLVTEAIEHVTPTGVVSADGREREFDTVVCATGFKVMEKGYTPPYPIYGCDGLELGEFWDTHRFQAYQGVSVPKFPNAFLIVGPYAFAPGSHIPLIESTSAHAARVIKEARRRGASRVEVRQEPHDRYFARMDARAKKTHLFTQGCLTSNTYYINYQGDGAAFRPSTQLEMYWENRHFPLDDYRFTTSVREPQEAVP
ncbi:NAD(P)/FAD-dependent oxidoreductase [Nocardia yunnanensis]|uniref:NAD(P)/FAD-dependent oxidoreductase n=1 Tax=Nocardia yunnanensis TaxID=2382165 RepID=A0A386ZPJ5_9NOCA|nr:NAD(P)/FAD-dependent oxidoreductase [Nocardia yunnanensis]AYF79591.1 NAD(P)/FAD-dependent oxidoreductase [Nocardia yunnanensis]